VTLQSRLGLGAAALVCFLALPATVVAQTGKLVSTGSDTLGALSAIWAQSLMRDRPGVTVQVRAIGSSAAPTALIEGTAELGPMSRPMSRGEQAAFRERVGYDPLGVPVAVDNLAVFVHRHNPLTHITRRALDAVFSASRRCGAAEPQTHWADLGLPGDWAPQPIARYGRSSASGTYGYFRQTLLCGGDFAARVNRLVGSAAVVRAVSTDTTAIGYASAGFLSDGVRQLSVTDEDGVPLPLSRDLLVYINRPPGAPLPPLVRAYLEEALSRRGQQAVLAAGYTPLGESRLAALRRSLDLGGGSS
jgi:phosphate transport system substrate-binding protein